LSSTFSVESRNGKIHSTPLFKVKKIVIFNKERYLKVKGIVKSIAGKVLKEKTSKILGAKKEKVFVLKKSVKDYRGYSDINYTKQSQVWSWIRLNRWSKDLKDYYENPKQNTCIK